MCTTALVAAHNPMSNVFSYDPLNHKLDFIFAIEGKASKTELVYLTSHYRVLSLRCCPRACVLVSIVELVFGWMIITLK